MACEFPQRCGRLDCELLYPYTLYFSLLYVQVEYRAKLVPPCRFLGHVVPTRHVALSNRDKHRLSLVGDDVLFCYYYYYYYYY